MFRIIAVCGILFVVGIMTLYSAFVRGRRAIAAKGERTVFRFSFLERGLHALITFCVLVLGGTGFVSVFVYNAPLSGWLGLAHMAAAPVFAVTSVIILLIWAEDDRFDAWQRWFLWLTSLCAVLVMLTGLGRMCPVFSPEGQVILYEVHRYSALVLVLCMIFHLYLRTLANPGTVWAMVSGYVSPEWARRHHPSWFERICKGGKGKDV